jgi:ABC-2 type transport system ATP-binding protein
MEYLLETKGISKIYSDKKVVNSVNMHIRRGDIYGFVGKNGAGKSTTMKMISGLITPEEGEINMFGYAGEELRSNNVLSRIGSLIERPALYSKMTALENLEMKCICAGISNRKDYIKNLLKQVGLENTGKKKVGSFSLGMKQRLGIAMSLIGEPDLLLLDEPIIGLDPEGIAKIREILIRLNKERNVTILIASHLLEELSKLATIYGFIKDGKLIAEISKEEIGQKNKSYIEITLDNAEIACTVLDNLSLNDYKVIDSKTIHVYNCLDKSNLINKELVKADVSVESINIVNASLEDFYFDVIGGNNNA